MLYNGNTNNTLPASYNKINLIVKFLVLTKQQYIDVMRKNIISLINNCILIPLILVINVEKVILLEIIYH